MKFRLLSLSVGLLISIGQTLAIFTEDRILAEKDDENTKRFVVRFKKDSKEYASRLDKAAKDAGKNDETEEFLTYGKFLPRFNVEVMILEDEKEVQQWEENEEVESVELDQKRYLQAESIPYGITSVQALAVPDGLVSNRKVCIVDSGYDINHEDLQDDLTIVNGYTGGNSAGPWNQDGNGHGTHVAGTIAAIGGNDKGVVGVNRNGELKLHIVRVFGNDGYWAWGSTLVAAIEECVKPGVDSNIINLSLGGGGFQQWESDAYDDIFNEDNALLVAAAGNGGSPNYFYPASYPAMVSVAAIDSNNNRASFSQYNDQVDIAAPGVNVLSTLPGSVYGQYSGTSMASPHVAGVAALVWSLDTSLTNAEVRDALYLSAQDLGTPGKDIYYGHGLVRADLAAALIDDGFTPAPTASPTAAPPCEDDPLGWYDSDGPQYDCEWYSIGTRCQDYGDSFENFGKTANEACCACGGGRLLESDVPTQAPSDTPTVTPTLPPCVDSPLLVVVNGTPQTCFWVFVNNGVCDDPEIASTCPYACGACDEYLCADAEGTVIYGNQERDCAFLRSRPDSQITNICESNVSALKTCRDTCGYCDP